MAKLNMPKKRALRKQAAQIAGASLPSKKSIRRQYGRAINDASGFTTALVELLRSSGGGGQAYADAADQQRAIDDAARQELGELGPQFAGAATTVGAAGDSALSRLLAGGAAEKAYTGRQPGIAAGRGAVAKLGLTNAMLEAMTQRDEAFQRGFGPALQQVTQNAQSRALALAQLGLSEQQLAATVAQNQAQLGMQQQQMSQQERQWAAEFGARYGFDPYTGKPVGGGKGGGGGPAGVAKSLGLTTKQVLDFRKAGATDLNGSPNGIKYVPVYVNADTKKTSVGVRPAGEGWQVGGYQSVRVPGAQRGALERGVPFQVSLQHLVTDLGIPAPIAIWTATRVYRTARGRTGGAGQAWASYLSWLQQRGQRNLPGIVNSPH